MKSADIRASFLEFFRAQGHETGNSLVEEEGIGLARDVLARAEGGGGTRASQGGARDGGGSGGRG